MINSFFSALIAIFFLGKSTKEVEEKTSNSSWFRTSVYFLLTIIFGIVFYKSYQVRTVVNKIDIKTLCGIEDSLHHSLDTIKNVCIYNNFETLGSYYNQYFEIAENDTSYNATGGFSIKIAFAENVDGALAERDSLSDALKRDIEIQTGKAINTHKGSVYDFEFFSTNIPSLIHFYPAIRCDNPTPQTKSFYSTIEKVGTVSDINPKGRIGISKSNPSEGYFVDGFSYQKLLVFHDDFFRKVLKSFPLGMPNSFVNEMTIFTAGDLSQYTYCIELNSDMYVDSLEIVYNVPIEVSNQSEKLITYANGFGISDGEFLNKEVGSKPMMFLVKLPSMANLQQIRSLLLTAIVTALFTLFCTNLFYRIRKHAMEYKSNHALNISKGVMSFKKFLIIFVLVLLIVILFFVFMSALGYVFLVENEHFRWIIVRNVGLSIIVLSAIIFYIYKFAKTPPSKKIKKE